MPDDTRRPDEGGRDSGDETVAGAPLDETQQFRPGGDETQRFRPGGDETQAFTREDDATAAAPAPSVWSGRAEVPPAGVRAPGPATAQWERPEWERPPGDDEGRRWWLPIVIGLVGLVLLGVLGYGLWLIAAAEDEPEPTPTATRPAPTARPTTAAPTTAEPTQEEEEEVEVPGLVGESLEDAQDRLDARGLTYRVEFEESESAEPGTVLRTRPEGGSRVEPGSQVTIVVAAAPEETEPPNPPAPSPSAEESPGGE